jgi:hypothetical protein
MKKLMGRHAQKMFEAYEFNRYNHRDYCCNASHRRHPRSPSYLTDIENAAEIIRTSGDVALVGLRLYPQLHLYIRNPVNIIALDKDPTLPTTIRYMISKNLTRTLAITTINMSKQLEEFKENPDIYNATISPQLGKEKIVSIDRIRCETIYRGNTLSIYIIEVTENKNEISRGPLDFPIITGLPTLKGEFGNRSPSCQDS